MLNKSIQKEARVSEAVSTSMSAAILQSKMRYAKKATPEDHYHNKISQAILETSSETGNDEDEPIAAQSRGIEPTRKKKRTTQAHVSIEANKAHTKMCNKAMKMMDKIQSVSNEYNTSNTD